MRRQKPPKVSFLEKIFAKPLSKTKNQGMKVYLCGGIFENNPCIVEKLQECLDGKYQIIVNSQKTIFGSVMLAIKHFKIDGQK